MLQACPSLADQALRRYLLHWPQGMRPRTVHLQSYEHPRQLSGPSLEEITQHPVVYGQGIHEDGANQTIANERRAHSALMRILKRLSYYQGTIKLRMRFGRFLAKQYILPEYGSYDLEEYEAMTKESQFQGMITHEYVPSQRQR